MWCLKIIGKNIGNFQTLSVPSSKELWYKNVKESTCCTSHKAAVLMSFELYGSPLKILGPHDIILVCTKLDNENLVIIFKFQEFTKSTFNFIVNSTNHLFSYFTTRSPLHAFNNVFKVYQLQISILYRLYCFFWIL